MESAIYQTMRQIEDKHWWFVVRRRIVEDMLKKLDLQPDARILDAGCGTGGNLEMLSNHGIVTGLEMEKSAANYSRARQTAHIVEGSLPDNLPLSRDTFDLVTMIDVLEHIDDDIGSVSAVKSLLVDGGYSVITVPAFQFLWSAHDDEHHHKRRYTKELLIRVIESTGLKLQYISYFNTWLFPVAAIVRMASKFTPFRQLGGSGADIPTPRVNSALTAVFNTERTLLKRMQLPFGLSLVAIVRKERDCLSN